MTNLVNAENLPVIDHADAMKRFDGDKAFFTRLAAKYPNDTSFTELEEALAKGDTEAAYHAAHTLKGVAGNLSFAQLFSLASATSDSLRNNHINHALELMPPLRDAHQRVLETLTSGNM